METFDLIALGDSTIDTFIKIHDASLMCDINNKDCSICFPYGSKIPVEEIDYGVAGNAANVVTGCQKLGLVCAIYTNLGDDDQGTRIKQVIEKTGVAANYITVVGSKKSNLSVVLTFQGERTIFVYHQDWYYQLPQLADAKWVYLTSMAETFTSSNIMDDVCHYLERSRAKLVYSPGTFQLKANVKRYPRILEKCEVLIVNREEALKILELDSKEKTPMRDILAKLVMLGPKMAVVTDSIEGSYATDGQRFLKAGIVPVKITEKTGAGDAYSAGLLAGLFKGEDLSEAMVWGAINSSSVVSRLTTQGGQLSYDEIIQRRKKIKDFEVVNI